MAASAVVRTELRMLLLKPSIPHASSLLIACHFAHPASWSTLLGVELVVGLSRRHVGILDAERGRTQIVNGLVPGVITVGFASSRHSPQYELLSPQHS